MKTWLLAATILLGCQVNSFDAVSSKPLPAGGSTASPDAGVDSGVDSEVDSDIDSGVDPGLSCGDTTRDIDNCGSCGRVCTASQHALPECLNSECAERRVLVLGSSPKQAHGSFLGGSAYPHEQLCPDQEVLQGIAAISDRENTNLYGFGVRCGRISLSAEESGAKVSVSPAYKANTVGGNVVDQTDPQDLLCPEGHIVTAVAGATHLFNGDLLSVRQLVLTCSRVGLNPEGNVVLEAPSSMLTVGDPNGTDRETFADPCPPGAAVVGFTGHSGALIDSITAYCGRLMTSRSLAGVPGS